MKSVSRFESHLLRLLHFFLRQAPIQQALPLLEAKLDRPSCLSRDAVDLVRDALAKGCVLLLARAGAWRRERFLRDGKPVEGSLWERTPPSQLGLTFSRNTLDLLMWITAKKIGDDKKENPWRPVTDATIGDLVFLYFVHGALRTNEIAIGLIGRPPLDAHGLSWLAYPEDHARAGNETAPSFAPWVSGVGACVLEALQRELADRWVRMEKDKGTIVAWQQMRDLGRAQERGLDAFLSSLEGANRFDLARFLLQSAAEVLTPGASPATWTGSLHQTGQRLADRADTYRGAMAFVRQMPRLQRWARRARTTGYFDEGYHEAQLWLADWERLDGDVLAERAVHLIRELDPMRRTEDAP